VFLDNKYRHWYQRAKIAAGTGFISASLKGHTINVGRKHSEATKEKIREATRQRSQEVRARVSAALSAYHAERKGML
jgi:NUMOD3 motif-containing protein